MARRGVGLTSSADSLPEVIDAAWKPAEQALEDELSAAHESLACFDGARVHSSSM